MNDKYNVCVDCDNIYLVSKVREKTKELNVPYGEDWCPQCVENYYVNEVEDGYRNPDGSLTQAGKEYYGK